MGETVEIPRIALVAILDSMRMNCVVLEKLLRGEPITTLDPIEPVEPFDFDEAEREAMGGGADETE